MSKSKFIVVSSRARALVMVASVATATAAWGQTWTGLAGDGMFSNGLNWSSTPTAPVSDPTTALTFPSLLGNYAVNLDAPTTFTLNSLTFNNTATTTLTGGTYIFDGTAPALSQMGAGNATIASRISVISTLAIAGSGSGAVTLSGGITSSATGTVVKSGSFALNLGASSFGTLGIIAGTASFTTGTVALTGTSTSLYAGSFSGPAALVTIGAGGKISPTGTVLIGHTVGANGSLVVSGGGLLTAASTSGILLGADAGATGNLTVTGTGSSVTFSGNLLGGNATNSFSNMAFLAGGKMQAGIYALGQGAQATVNLTVNGGTLAATGTGSSSLGFGSASFTSVLVTGGGQLTNGGAWNVAATNTGSHVGVTVTGTGSRLTTGGQELLSFSDSASVDLTISAGGSVSFGGNAFVSLVTNTNTSILVTGLGSRLNGVGSLIMSGGSGGAIFSGNTTFRCEAGASTTLTGSFVLANSTGGRATATVTGTGSLLTVGGTFGGAVSTSTYCGLALLNGSRTTLSSTGQIQLALYDSSNGNILIDNSILTSTATGTVFLAGVSTATNAVANLTIRNGGIMSLTRTGNTNGFQGATAFGATATLLVDGGTFSDSATGAYFLATSSSSTFNLTARNNGVAKFGTGTMYSAYVGDSTYNITAELGGTVAFTGSQLMGWNGGGGGTVNINLKSGGLYSASNTTFMGASGFLSTVIMNVSSAAYAGSLLIMGANGTTEGGQANINLGDGGTVGVSLYTVMSGTATVTMTGGTFTTRGLSNAGAPAFKGLVELNGGTMTLNGLGLAASTNFLTGVAFTGSAGSLVLNSAFLTETLYGTGGNFSGPITVTAGTLSFASSTPVGLAKVSVATSASIGFNVTGTASGYVSEGSFASLTIAGTGTTVANARPSNFAQILTTGTLAIPAGGSLNLGSGDMLVHSTLESILDGYAQSGALTSSGSVATYTGLAIITNADGMGGALYSTFDGVSVSSTDVLVKYTYIGDTDLNGVVDGADLENLLAGMSGGLHGYGNGDLDYSGTIDITDYNLLLASLANQGASFGNGSGPSGAVPEPTLFLPAVASLGLLSRRRR